MTTLAAGAGADFRDWYFYVDHSQLAGPTRLTADSPGITINGVTEQPIILLLGQDATTSSWPNRGSLGGSLTAVNIRAEDLGCDTPYTDGTKAVRFRSDSSNRRYYEASDSTFGDIDTEDLVVAAVFLSEETGSGFDSCVAVKRSVYGSSVGWSCWSGSAPGQVLTVRPVGDTTRSAGLTRTFRCWTHITGWWDYSLGVVGIHLGSQSGTGVAGLTGSLSNSEKFRIGDSIIPGTNNIGFRLAYLAVYKRSDWLPGVDSATNQTAVLSGVRIQQAYLGGYVDSVSGATPTTITSVASTTFTFNENNERIAHALGTGCVAPTVDILRSTGEKVTGHMYQASSNGQATAEIFTTGWTHTNGTSNARTAVTNNCPFSSNVGVAGAGINMVGANNTDPVYSAFTILAAVAAARKFLLYTWVKAGTAPYFYYDVEDRTGNTGRQVWVDLSTNAITYGTGDSLHCEVQNFKDGWKRILFTLRKTTANVDTVVRWGWSDAASSTVCTSNGTDVTGSLFGWQQITTTDINFSNIYWPYWGNASSTNIGTLVIYSGSPVTHYPVSLWHESYAAQNQNGYQIASYPLQLSTSSTSALYTVGQASNNTMLEFSGQNSSLQWQIFPANQTGDNAYSSGNRIRWTCVAAGVNDIKLLNRAGDIVGTDTSATLPPLPLSNIRVGNSASGSVSGRTIITSRFGIAKVAKTDSSGPPGSGITE